MRRLRPNGNLQSFRNDDAHGLDGMHRVAKACLLGFQTVSAVRFDKPIDPELVLEVLRRISPQEIKEQISRKRLETPDHQ